MRLNSSSYAHLLYTFFFLFFLQMSSSISIEVNGICEYTKFARILKFIKFISTICILYSFRVKTVFFLFVLQIYLAKAIWCPGMSMFVCVCFSDSSVSELSKPNSRYIFFIEQTIGWFVTSYSTLIHQFRKKLPTLKGWKNFSTSLVGFLVHTNQIAKKKKRKKRTLYRTVTEAVDLIQNIVALFCIFRFYC